MGARGREGGRKKEREKGGEKEEKGREKDSLYYINLYWHKLYMYMCYKTQLVIKVINKWRLKSQWVRVEGVPLTHTRIHNIHVNMCVCVCGPCVVCRCECVHSCLVYK